MVIKGLGQSFVAEITGAPLLFARYTDGDRPLAGWARLDGGRREIVGLVVDGLGLAVAEDAGNFERFVHQSERS